MRRAHHLILRRRQELLLCLSIAGLLWIILYFGSLGLRTYTYIQNGTVMARTAERYEQTGNDTERILVLGDSLAYGVGASRPETSFAGLIGARFPEASIINKARIGEDIAGLAQAIHADANQTYSKVFVLIGGNDVAHHAIDLDASARYLAEITSVLTHKAQAVYLYPPVNFDRVDASPSILDTLYSQRSRLVFDAAQAAAQPYANVSVVDAFNYDRNEYQSLQAADGFHLNDKGIAALVALTFPE